MARTNDSAPPGPRRGAEASASASASEHRTLICHMFTSGFSFSFSTRASFFTFFSRDDDNFSDDEKADSEAASSDAVSFPAGRPFSSRGAAASSRPPAPWPLKGMVKTRAVPPSTV